MSTFSTVSHAFRLQLGNAGHSVPLGHCQQIIAAAFGFNTLAAYQASPLSSRNLHDVRHLVIDAHFIQSRATELGTFPDAETNQRALTDALSATGCKIHSSLSMFEDYLRQDFEHFVQEDSDVVAAMAMANHDGVDEIYLPFELEDALPEGSDEILIDIEGHIGLADDPDRPYSGHIVRVVASISLDRLAPVAYGSVDYYVEHAGLDYGWPEEEDNLGSVQHRTLAQALADELELSVEEAEWLVDADCTTNESDDGLIYSYIFDFEPVVTEQLRSKLLNEHGSLQLEVNANFFDDIRGKI
ncbi:hypothetical protein ACNKH9_10175 [Metapseudomonas otitidis]|uniref:hypothetical protein n=1 Tax=Metapseudomonas otitidis TaxID=319939 RepID=UPI003A8B2AEB